MSNYARRLCLWTVHCLIRARLAFRPKRVVFGASAMDRRAAFGAKQKAVARNAKPLVGLNCETECDGSACACDDAKPTVLSSQEKSPSANSNYTMRKDFFSVVRMEGKFQGGYDRFWEKNLLLYAFTHKHTSGWFASHRKFSLPRIMAGLPELRCSAMTLGLCHLQNYRRLPSTFSEWHWIFSSECSSFCWFFRIFFSENFPSFLVLCVAIARGWKFKDQRKNFCWGFSFINFVLSAGICSPFALFRPWHRPKIFNMILASYPKRWQKLHAERRAIFATHRCSVETFRSAKNSRESLFWDWEPRSIAS